MKPARLKRGFTLIEVLFAVFLALTCALIVAAGMPVATKSRTRADLNNKATSLVQKQLEAVRGMGYANLTGGALTSAGLIDSESLSASGKYVFTNSDSSYLDNPSLILPQGQGFLQIEQVDLDLRRVTVEVQYVLNGQTRSVKLGTLVANL